MFEIDNIHHSKYELADYLEYKALSCAEGICSILNLRSGLSAPDDELSLNGTEEGDDKVIAKLQEALTWCAQRRRGFAVYPYDTAINSLAINNPLERKAYYYFFLLLTNRLNMRDEKEHGGKDATELFERLCRCVASDYLGIHCKCEIIGTSVQGTFKDKINDILKNLNISGKYKEPYGGTGHHKDGGVDLIAWIPFKDNKDSQLIALGQCKTGDTWEVYLKKVDFFSNYSTEQPFVDPVYMFFVAEDYGNYKWEERSKSAGILFDRRRILDFLPDDISKLDENLDKDIITWVDAALDFIRKK